MQPEIESRGYVIAQTSHAADYFVHLRHPVDPLVIGRITFVEAPPNVPFLRKYETEQERIQRQNKTALAEMAREPK
jgi:hypothetical protein